MGKKDKSKKKDSSSSSSSSSSDEKPNASQAKLVAKTPTSGRGSNASKRSSSARNNEPVDENANTYEYQKFATALDSFKRSEPQTMSKLERLAKSAAQGDGNGMGDAVQKTEAIRNWREQTWAADELCKRLNTCEKRGLTAQQVIVH